VKKLSREVYVRPDLGLHGSLQYVSVEESMNIPSVRQVFRRADRPDLGKREEEYQPLGDFEKEPGAAEITPLFAPKPKAPTWKTYWNP